MIYILCPANIRTGGPELCHQLGYKLRMMGFDARMYYYWRNESIAPVVPDYEKYNVPFEDTVVDDPSNIVIIPESVIEFMCQINYAHKIIWWLSVDNAKATEDQLEYMKNCKDIDHFVQSQYAFEYVKDELNIPETQIKYLSDYINSSYIIPGDIELERKNIVLFNPNKGFNKTAKIISKSDARVFWQALRGLTAPQMANLMSQSKVYIDFGRHPGKDRIPREAALSGCCVITNKKGAARNTIDVSIPDEYKLDDTGEELSDEMADQALSLIYKAIDNYENAATDFGAYVEKTKKEFIDFEVDIYKCFMNINKHAIPDDFEKEYGIAKMIENIEKEDYLSAFQYLIKYRYLGYEENIVFSIVETNIRIGVHEYQEAIYCAEKGLQIDNTNYELHILMARSYKELSYINKMREHCTQALNYCKGSGDEEYIVQVCGELIRGM